MKTWHAILIAGAMIASAIIVRVDVTTVTPAHAGEFSPEVADCIVKAANAGAGFGEGAILLRSACQSLYDS